MARKKKTQIITEPSFNNLFLLNKTEKKKIFNMIQKKHINYLLFYTDYRNLTNIFQNGIRQLKKINLKTDEVYYVWSYLQHEESIDLEFDISSRAYFWKWATDSGLNISNMCVIGINPVKLIEQTVNDWFYDSSLKLVSVHETIPSESFDWVMVRKPEFVGKLESMVKDLNLNMRVYFGTGSEIKRSKKQTERN